MSFLPVETKSNLEKLDWATYQAICRFLRAMALREMKHPEDIGQYQLECRGSNNIWTTSLISEGETPTLMSLYLMMRHNGTSAR